MEHLVCVTTNLKPDGAACLAMTLSGVRPKLEVFPEGAAALQIWVKDRETLRPLLVELQTFFREHEAAAEAEIQRQEIEGATP